jgi:ubiquinone/menaquinone biosynthesis C-methylase UbiE
VPRADRQRETERVRAIYDRAAPRYDRSSGSWFLADGREWLCGAAVGDTLEVGVGTGRNLGLYPTGVRLVGIELSPNMLGYARRRASGLPRPVELLLGDAQDLPFEATSFDTVVLSLVLCSVPDPARAVSEVARVLRPGGRLRALEHVRSTHLGVRLVQRLLDPLAVRREGDHLVREPVEVVRAAGLRVDSIDRRRLGLIERLVAIRDGDTRP